MTGFNLKEKQQYALERALSGDNILITGSGGCVDKDTEFLTRDGWKKISEFSVFDDVGVYNTENDTLFFEQPENYIKKTCEWFYHVKTRNVDMMLSPCHDILYWPTKNSLPRKIKMEKMKERHDKSVDGWQGKIKSTFNYDGPGINVSEGYLRLQVAVMADGRIVKEGKNNYTQMRFNKKRKYERLINLCKTYNLPYSDRKVNSQGQYEVIVWPILNDKNFTSRYYKCSNEQLSIILDEIRYWDSHIEKSGNVRYFSVNKSDADFVAFMLSSQGYLSHISLDKREDKKCYTVGASKNKKHFRSIANKDKKLVINKVKSENNYMYCFRVSTGSFIAKRGSHIFITGNCGKSTTVNKIMDPNTVLCAPTGIAALNVRGVTCHSLFGLPIGVPLTEDFMKIPFKMRELFNNWSPVKRIVISECSMLRTDMFELINSRLQMLRGNREPFGGIQVVMEGDYFQLDPIVSPRDEKLFYREYESPFNFTSDIFDFEIVELTEVLRQSNKRQIDMLNSIRRKDKYYKFALDAIIKESKPYVPSKDVTHLCCYKKDANKYNKKYFNELTTPVYSFEAKITGNDKWTDSIVPHTLKLREGARVILKCNDQDGQFVNGEKGVVTYVDEILIKVLKDNGVEVVVYPNEWEKYEYHTGSKGVEKEITSTFTQYPLDLAYGQSIHSSQSMTLDNLALDIGRGCFAHGQLYVALSRITDIKNLSFVNKPVYSDVICHKDVKQFYRKILE